jgi:rhamnogalacturonyl hydrolase YesR
LPDHTYHDQDNGKPVYRIAAGYQSSEPYIRKRSGPVENKVRKSFENLLAYCEKEKFMGYDPYDGLNSRLFKSIPYLSKNRLARLIWIQAFKRLPVNLRPLTGVKKGYNPKALGLFLSGYCNLFSQEPEEKYLEKIEYFSDKLGSLSAKGWSGYCWGYNFDWQARAFFQPENTPTVVATTFVACALLDAYEITKEDRLIKMARSACDFILKDLNRTYDENGDFAFSYSPLDNSVVFNASLLGSRLLARVFSYTHEPELSEAAGKSVRFCCGYQHKDGSWSYGKQSFHQWIDNFHTGYNLECLYDFMKFTGTNTWSDNFEAGMKYYLVTFFTSDGVPKYYNNSVYPIDIHSSAQLLVTLAKTGRMNEHKELAARVLDWTLDNMQSKDGYFYYQINKHFSSRIPYMRWAQAWMFYAMTFMSPLRGQVKRKK